MAGAIEEPAKREPFVLPEATPHERAKAQAVAEEIEDPEVRERFANMMEKGARAKRA